MWPWSRFRNRNPQYEVTADGRERIVLVSRRHSYDGSARSPRSPRSQGHSVRDDDDDRDRRNRGQYQHLIAENDDLRARNARLLRDNQNLQRAMRDVAGERDWHATQNQRRGNLRSHALQQLEQGLETEKSARRRAERALRDEKAARDRREAELLTQMRRLRSEETTWRARAAALTTEVRDFVRLNQQKEDRIRTLEEWMRRQGVLPLRPR